VTDYVLALATLGSATQTGSFVFVSHHPRRPRQGKSCVIFALNFANGNMALQGILTTCKLGHYFVTETRLFHELFIILLFNLFGSIVVSTAEVWTKILLPDLQKVLVRER
jgi:hypothetical protein